jgi:hypothetical protein
VAGLIVGELKEPILWQGLPVRSSRNSCSFTAVPFALRERIAISATRFPSPGQACGEVVPPAQPRCIDPLEAFSWQIDGRVLRPGATRIIHCSGPALAVLPAPGQRARASQDRIGNCGNRHERQPDARRTIGEYRCGMGLPPALLPKTSNPCSWLPLTIPVQHHSGTPGPAQSNSLPPGPNRPEYALVSMPEWKSHVLVLRPCGNQPALPECFPILFAASGSAGASGSTSERVKAGGGKERSSAT